MSIRWDDDEQRLRRWEDHMKARRHAASAREDNDMPTAGAIVWSIGAVLVAVCGVGLWLILR